MPKPRKRPRALAAAPAVVYDGREGRADYGDDLRRPGWALSRRPSAIEKVGGEMKAGKADVADYARCYQDASLFDRMWHVGQLSDVQHKAADRLGEMWTAAGLDQRVGSRYSDLPSGRALDAADDEATPRDRYRALMRGRRDADLLEDMLCGRHPGWRVERLQMALDTLAREWGIR